MVYKNLFLIALILVGTHAKVTRRRSGIEDISPRPADIRALKKLFASGVLQMSSEVPRTAHQHRKLDYGYGGAREYVNSGAVHTSASYSKGSKKTKKSHGAENSSHPDYRGDRLEYTDPTYGYGDPHDMMYG